jgi:hypothetical protein
LVTDANNKRVNTLRSKGTLAELKVHYNQLKTCSKYFEACMSTRWTVNPNSPSTNSMEFTLEKIYGV